MKKVGIITIIDNNNYGNRLQNYALQEVIKVCGYKAITLRVSYIPSNLVSRLILKIKQTASKSSLIVWIYNLFTGKHCVKCKEDPLEKKRERALYDFSEKYIDSATVYFDNIDNSHQVKKMDYFWTGSDQVWNPEGWLNDKLAFLLFCPKEKRMSYAASFGVEDIPEEKEGMYSRYLNDFRFISVRENSGQAIVKKLTGKDVDVFLDPTLMLKKENWLKLEQSTKVRRPYVLTYFLDEMDEQIRRDFEFHAKEMKWDIIELQNRKEENWYTINPRQFLFLFHHAEFILTDSFHGTVFSLIFHKSFWCFCATGKRRVMFDRIQTLLGTVGLEERIYKENEVKCFTPICEEKYNEVDRILDEKQKVIFKKIKDLKL